ncbi:DNA-binding transcriptional regulator, FadR family [Terribacillus halophilus]|uniref:DNA-binding transcriptional regulator, FadR family n=1 Tax=Terribacillus halophilus TaxID=361279 RepID=A0A1G6IX71_9BACI|nr:FadR/GntR family transcriptional regulator [Terribacillus halophilus]SDC10991.1 DNA-binding transcriptional regulator, FadR family [Terribacillus halophilus]
MKKEKVAHRIAAEILEQIVEGDVKPGQKLPTEKKLCEKYGVSRASIREALSELKAQGAVTSKQGGGTYVEQAFHGEFFQQVMVDESNLASFRYLFEMRKILEPEAAMLAAERRTKKELDAMLSALELMKGVDDAESHKGRDADFAFHLAVMKATHNPVMIQTFANLDTIYKKALALSFEEKQEIIRNKQIIYKEHENIFEAIQAGEAELARLQCLIHLRNVEKKLTP